MHCGAGVQTVEGVSEPTDWAQGCWVAVSESTYRALCCRGAGCLSGVEPTCRALCCRGAGCINGFWNLPVGPGVAWVQVA